MKKETTKPTKTVKKTTQKTAPTLTLLQAIERVVELSKDSMMSDVMMESASAEIGLLTDSYGITPRQAVLFCICMERGPRRVDYDDFASHLDINKIAALSYAGDIDALVRRRLLRFRDAKDEDDFDVPTAVIRCLKHNEVYELPKCTDLDCSEMFELLNLWFEDLDDGAISAHEMKEQLAMLFDQNPQVAFARKIKDLGLNANNQLLLTLFCHLFINQDDDDVRLGQMEDVYGSKGEFRMVKGELRQGTHCLQKMMLVEHRCEDGIADTSRYKLTENAKNDLLAELNINVTTEKLADVQPTGSIVEKQLFFPANIERQVNELGSFLQNENFRKVQERMKEKGFRNGFACLFYGGPGTGKTETVFQLARQTGRDIMVVDVPQIKSKWVGESEKNIKALFDRYREQVKQAKITPILLFNEADAIIGIRRSGAESAVDKMENSIQNIILQEMETLDGIMIATTNLQQNLDKAFERRFLYKIHFEKPTVEARARIWHSMIPELSDTDLQTLAAKYDFSGGQIENIARHFTIDTILHGNDSHADTLALLISHCDNERLGEREQKRVGF